MKGMSQVSKEEMSSMMGKWFTMTLMGEDGHVFKDVAYCAEIQDYGLVNFFFVNPDLSLDWKKLSCVYMDPYDMRPINNFVYRYFNLLLEKLTLTDTGYSEIAKRIMLSTCFDMVTDEKLYGDDGLSILEYVFREAFRRIGEKKSGLGEFESVYDTMQRNMQFDLLRYLYFYMELCGESECVEDPSMEPGYRSFLTSSEWAEEKEWCSLHSISTLG